MKRLRKRTMFLLLAGFVACPFSESAAHDFYYPAVSGKPAGYMDGTILEYGQGMSSGSLGIRLADRRRVIFNLASLPFRVNGARIDCKLPPIAPTYRRDPAFCSSWPANLRLGSTRVRVFYWKGRRYGRPTLIAGKLVTLGGS